MQLKELLKKYIIICEEIEIFGIECDSRKVKAGDLFLAYPGEGSDGRNFIDNAINNGAVAVLAEKSEANIKGCNIPIFFINNLKKYIGKIAAEFYNYPSSNISIIGITGTNGKTSTTFYIANILNGMGIRTAVIGTTGYGIPGKLIEIGNTTPGPIELQKIFAELRDKDIKTVAMEISSHALVQKRVLDINIDSAIFTNLSQDHLDYHQNMEDYAEAKKMLFDIPSVKNISLNIDDKYGKLWFENLNIENKKLIGFSSNENYSDRNCILAKDIKLDMDGLSFELSFKENKFLIENGLLGHFNVNNILAAVSILYLMGYNFDKIAEQSKCIKPVPGRMQVCRSGNSCHPIAVVDYSHTPDALENALSALKRQCIGNLICVFGCGGNRDRKKRPLMAQAVEKYSDIIIVSNDNPRFENECNIIGDIKSGFSSFENVTIEPDRKKAIGLAIKKGTSNDLILVAGKGHEDYQIINGVKHHFSDVEVVEEFFQNDK